MRIRGRVFDYGRRRKLAYGPVTVFYAEPGGGLVLRGERAWHKASGIMLNTRRGFAWAMLRRWQS